MNFTENAWRRSGLVKGYGPWSNIGPGMQSSVASLCAGALYAQTHPFGAAWEPASGRVLHGVGNYQPQEAALGMALADPALAPASHLRFCTLNALGFTQAQSAAALLVKGAVTHLSIGFWLTEGIGLDVEIATTTKHDERIRFLARMVRDHGDPVLVRPGFEFNGSWFGYHVASYPVAFRKVVDLFRSEGAANAGFVWSYEPDASADFTAWYPGDWYVDWFSVDLFHRDHIVGPSDDNTKVLAFLGMAAAHDKPVFISECSSIDVPMKTASWSEWFGPFFAFLEAHPSILGFNYINFDWSGSGYTGWQDGDLTHNAALLSKYRDELAKPRYVHASEVAGLKL